MKQGLLIKYGEIAIKGNNRYKFENVLMQNIKTALKSICDVWISKEQGRFLIEAEDSAPDGWVQQAADRACKVFGVIGVSPVSVFDDDGLDSIEREMIEHLHAIYPTDSSFTFKIEGRRANKHYPLNSMELASLMGGKVLDAYPGWTVDVHNPQVKVYIELRNRCYVYSKTFPGVGGMPVGTGGAAALLLSGGIDSPVAGWMMAKRGVSLSCVYFHAHPYTTDRARDKVLELARRISVYAGPIRVYVVPFTDLQLQMVESCPHEQLTIIMRRTMMWVAEGIARKEGAQALITGESLGQVASQTMEGLVCTDAAASMPVFRPLIGFDKQDIVEIAQRIDTFETSILPYEDCCTIFVAKHPETKPKLKSILKSESHLENLAGGIQKAIDESTIYLAREDGVTCLRTNDEKDSSLQTEMSIDNGHTID